MDNLLVRMRLRHRQKSLFLQSEKQNPTKSVVL